MFIIQAKCNKQRVALTGLNTTGPPCSVGRPTAHAPGCPARRPSTRLAAARRKSYDRRQTTTDASQQNNTGPLGGPVINIGCWGRLASLCQVKQQCVKKKTPIL